MKRGGDKRTLWLQNAANLTIIAKTDPHFINFCKELGISNDQLIRYTEKYDIEITLSKNCTHCDNVS
jgi:hypothetical protein